jgi:preprotein translocase subunit SecF
MVARTAYTQLLYSNSLLLACTFMMTLMYVLPLIGLIYFSGKAWFFSLFSIVLMLGLYQPTQVL